jgi:hypothetical protein
MKKLTAILLILSLLTPLCALAQSTDLGEDEAIGRLPGKQWALHDLTGVTTQKISQLTGEDSPNKTLSRFGVWGTDLCSFTVLDGKTYLFGGDTFSSENSEGWRSNVLLISEDTDPSDGLDITDAVTDKRGNAKELLLSIKQDNTEMTVIPTNLFSAQGKLYCVYMSVSHWGDAGRWDCRYSGLAVSEDGGKKWVKLPDVKWPGDSGFIQTANVQVEDTMYFWGILSGRFGGVSLMKVPVAQLEDMNAYRYYTGKDEAGLPVWESGDAGIAHAAKVIRRPVGEISVIYDEYLGNFLITYLDEGADAIVLREGVTPWGEYGEAYDLATPAEYPSLYGAYMHPDYVSDGGKGVYFTMSQYFPIYNVMWMRFDLP